MCRIFKQVLSFISKGGGFFNISLIFYYVIYNFFFVFDRIKYLYENEYIGSKYEIILVFDNIEYLSKTSEIHRDIIFLQQLEGIVCLWTLKTIYQPIVFESAFSYVEIVIKRWNTFTKSCLLRNVKVLPKYCINK